MISLILSILFALLVLWLIWAMLSMALLLIGFLIKCAFEAFKGEL